MNKRTFASYLKGSKRGILKNNCFKHDNGFLVSDSFSIIKLNDNNQLNIGNDTLNISKLYDNFVNNYETSYTFSSIENDDGNFIPIENGYGINSKLFKKIKTIIKANWYSILVPKDNICVNINTPIIKLENTKTKEDAYLLPMRKY